MVKHHPASLALPGIFLVWRADAHVVLTKPASRNFLASRVNQAGWPWHTCPQCLSGGGIGAVQAAQEQLTGIATWQGYPESTETAERHPTCGGSFHGDESFNDNGVWSPLSNTYQGSNPNTWGHDLESPFVAGGNITFEIEVTAHHKGHFEFYVCDKNDQADPSADTTAECLWS
jgi:hypothetical protein